MTSQLVGQVTQRIETERNSKNFGEGCYCVKGLMTMR